MADVEKTIRYKVEIDDSKARLQLNQLATAGQLNIATYAGANSPGTVVSRNGANTFVTPSYQIGGAYASPQSSMSTGLSSIAMGTHAAGMAAYGFGSAVVHDATTAPKYNDVLLPNGHYAIESTFGREIFSGLMGYGAASSDQASWDSQRGKPEWMTTAEYRSKLNNSLGERAKSFGWSVLDVGADVAMWGMIDWGLISGLPVKRGLDILRKQREYRREENAYLKNSTTIGDRSSGFGLMPFSEKDRGYISSAMQKEDMPFFDEFIGKTTDFTLKKTLEMASDSGIMFNKTESPEALMGKIKDIRKYLIKYAELMHTTRKSVAEIAGVLSQSGVGESSDIDTILGRMRDTTAYTGLSSNQLLRQYTGGMQMAGSMGYNPLIGMQLMSNNLQFYQTLKDQGQIKPWENIGEKSSSLTHGLLNLKNVPLGKAVIMGAIDVNTGKLDVDKLNDIASGDLSLSDAISDQYKGLSTQEMFVRSKELRNKMNNIDLKDPKVARGVAKALQSIITRNGGMLGDAATAVVAEFLHVDVSDVRKYLDDKTYNAAQDQAVTSAILKQDIAEGADIHSVQNKIEASISKEAVDKFTRRTDPNDWEDINSRGISPEKYISFLPLTKDLSELREGGITRAGLTMAGDVTKDVDVSKVDFQYLQKNYGGLVRNLAEKMASVSHKSVSEEMENAARTMAYQVKSVAKRTLGSPALSAIGDFAENELSPTTMGTTSSKDLEKLFSSEATDFEVNSPAFNKLKAAVDKMLPRDKQLFSRYVLLRKRKDSGDLSPADEKELANITKSIGRSKAVNIFESSGGHEFAKLVARSAYSASATVYGSNAFAYIPDKSFSNDALSRSGYEEIFHDATEMDTIGREVSLANQLLKEHYSKNVSAADRKSASIGLINSVMSGSPNKALKDALNSGVLERGTDLTALVKASSMSINEVAVGEEKKKSVDDAVGYTSMIEAVKEHTKATKELAIAIMQRK